MLKINVCKQLVTTFLRFIRWAGHVCGTWYKIVNDCMGVRRAAKRAFAPPGNWDLEPNISGKTWSRHLDSDWFDSCNGSLLTGMKLTLHKSQVHSYSIVSCCDELCCSHISHDELCCSHISRVCSSIMPPPLPAEAGCESREWIVLLLVFIA